MERRGGGSGEEEGRRQSMSKGRVAVVLYSGTVLHYQTKHENHTIVHTIVLFLA